MSIEIKNLRKSFGEKTVLDGITLTVDAPVVLTGPSGCGKTTLLRILMGLETPDGGSMSGVDLAKLAAVFQEDRICPQLTAVDNITLTGRGATTQQARTELQTLGFDEAALALPAARLSGGQKRRVALLRALLCRGADVLLFDEPFTGMDAELVGAAAAATVRLTAGRPAILVTHDAAAAAHLGWPVVTMGDNP